MSRRTLEVDILSRAGAVVRGHGSRDLIEELLGRPPVWLSRCRGWSVQTHRVPDLCSLAELRGFDVVVTGPRATTNTTRLVTTSTTKSSSATVEHDDPGQGLW